MGRVGVRAGRAVPRPAVAGLGRRARGHRGRGVVAGRNIAASGTARAAVGATRDVTMLDLELERSVPVDEDADLGAAYADQADWDPRGLAGYVFLVLRPTRVQAWREVDELPGRTLMRDGAWLAGS